MTDVLIYWRDYKQNWAAQFAGWHSKAKLFRQLEPGDHLWMVTSGANLGQDAKQAGFLVAIWTLQAVIDNPE